MNAAPATASPAAAVPAAAARGEGAPAADRAEASASGAFAALLGEAAVAQPTAPRAKAAAAAPSSAPAATGLDGDGDAAASADAAGPARATDDASGAAEPTPADTSDAAPDPAPAAEPGDWLALLRQSLGLAPGASAATPAATPDEGARGAARPAAPAASANAGATPAGAAVLASGSGLNPVPPEAAAPPLFALAGTADDGGDAPAVEPLPDPTLSADAARFGAAAALPGALAGAPPAADASSTAASPLPMTLPPDHPEFTDALGERIVWITDRGLGEAQIELHPLDLGSLTVRVQIRGDEAQIAFTAAQPATRALLQNALPQLRELLSVQGLQLLRAQVDARVAPARGGDAAFDTPREARETATRVRRVGRLELVDAYA
ncbi:flagellar hook-length control protein FliK [Solimonas variicoloris]|uniref:flagellar hook-length control protein FliK n=1 Tax=Solimonas variicoloris TaxID=254408 RepID=UPI0003697E1F|nr:flagellar hook-length control protein FliK [Solimonas variicoloris]